MSLKRFEAVPSSGSGEERENSGGEARPAVQLTLRAAASSKGLRLPELYDGGTRTSRGDVPVEPARQNRPARAGLAASGEPVSQAERSFVPSPRPSGAGWRDLPRSYWVYLTGLTLSGLGQAVAGVVIPVYAYHLQGVGLALLALLAQVVAILPGSVAGAWAVRRFGPKAVYVAANLLHAAVFASVPLTVFLAGELSPAHYLAFSAVTGAAYGALRGVAEQSLTLRLLGRTEEGLLRTAASMYYIFVAPAYMGAAFATTPLLPLVGVGWLALAGAALLSASALPYLALRLSRSPEGPKTPRSGSGGDSSLPAALYLPFIFFWANHLLFYYLYAPFFAAEVLGDKDLLGSLTGFYAMGNLAAALSFVLSPGLAERLRGSRWTALGVWAVLAFLFGSLLSADRSVAWGTALLMGAGITAGQLWWQAFYQKRLSEDRQPGVFSRLTVAYVAATLLPLLGVQAGLWAGLPLAMPALLGLAAIIVALCGAGMLWLLLRQGER